LRGAYGEFVRDRLAYARRLCDELGLADRDLVGAGDPRSGR